MPGLFVTSNARASRSQAHWINHVCAHKKNHRRQTEHTMLLWMNISWASAKLFLFFLHQVRVLYQGFCKCISNCVCSFVFCWIEENHWQPAVDLHIHTTAQEDSVWPIAETHEHREMRRKAMLVYGMGWTFWVPSFSASLVTNSDESQEKMVARMTATMKAHPMSMGTRRKAIGFEMHL